MKSDFLGVGWSSPVALTATGQIQLAEYEDLVRQPIWTILATAPGERVMRPDFGCGLHNFVFAPASASTQGQIASAVRRSLIEWEPRIDVLDVAVFPDDALPNRLFVQVNYQVRTTNNRFNLVYPFYLT